MGSKKVTYVDNGNLKELRFVSNPFIHKVDTEKMIYGSRKNRRTQHIKVDKILKVAKENLSDTQFRVFYLHFFEGLGVYDISKFVGVSEPAISECLKRCVKELRKLLSIDEKMGQKYYYGKFVEK